MDSAADDAAASSRRTADAAGNSRRSFLLSTGGLLTTAWLGSEWPAVTAAAHHADAAAAAPLDWQFFSAAQAADVEAIAAQVVPSGATPGAREARAVVFIDRALATFFAAWSQEFREGLHDFQGRFHADHPDVASFASAAADAQLAFLETVERTPFFESTRMLTLLGMFASPKYGGNASGSGWRMIGFEDRHAFTPPFGFYDAEYPGFVPYAAEGRT